MCLDSVQTGATALHASAQEGHLRVVEMLLEANADVNIKNNVTHPFMVLLVSGDGLMFVCPTGPWDSSPLSQLEGT